MANYPIYRLVKGSQLTFTEMDGNLEWLSRTMSASVVEITGSTYIVGNLTVSKGITGSLFGTSSWSQNSMTSSNFNGTASNGFVSNMSDTYTATAKITDIITLSSAEYAAIVHGSLQVHCFLLVNIASSYLSRLCCSLQPI